MSTPAKRGSGHDSCHSCALTSHPFMGALGTSQQQRLDRERVGHEYKRGARLFQQGSPASHLYCVRDAVVKFTRRSPVGREITVGIAGSGHLVGLGAVCRRGAHLTSATVVRGGTVCAIAAQTIAELQSECALFAQALEEALAAELGRAENRIGLLSCPRLEPKLAALLLEMESEESPRGPVLADFARRDLAELCGVSTEALVRCLTRWKSEGIIDAAPGPLQITDRTKLQELSLQL